MARTYLAVHWITNNDGIALSGACAGSYEKAVKAVEAIARAAERNGHQIASKTVVELPQPMTRKEAWDWIEDTERTMTSDWPTI